MWDGTEPEPAPDPVAGGASGGGGASVPEVTCTYTPPEELANGTGFEVLDGVFVRTAPDGSVELAYYKDCTDGTHGWVWIGDPAGEGAPEPTPADLADVARAKAEAALPAIEWHTPAEWNAQQHAFVQTPTYVWFDDGLWAPVSATASVGAVWARATARPTRVILDPGDGSAPVECDGEPPEYTAGTPTDGFAGCGHVYRHSSVMAPNGESYTVLVSVVWHVAWEGSDGSGGDLGEVRTSAAPRQLGVAEVQAIVTGS